MNIAITKMSQNGQVVIPSDIRNQSGIGSATRFLVFNKGGDILLKKINEKSLEEEMDLIKKIEKSEEQIKKGNFVKVDDKMNEGEIDSLLIK